jgi:hypothetical protein
MGDNFCVRGVLHPKNEDTRNLYVTTNTYSNYKMSNVWYSIVVVWYPGTVCGYNY